MTPKDAGIFKADQARYLWFNMPFDHAKQQILLPRNHAITSTNARK